MKAVMISIQPKWCEKIASGEKTIEVRKTKPKCKTPFKCFIYCTKASKKQQYVCGSLVFNTDELYRHPTQGIKYGDSVELMACEIGSYSTDNFLNGRVIGEFVCDKIDKISVVNIEQLTQACLTSKEVIEYAKGKTLYGWHICELKIYDKPKELSEFYKPLDCDKCGASKIKDAYLYCAECHSPKMTKAPQSWCYVEGENSND